MSLIRFAGTALFFLMMASCSQLPKPAPLSVHEQLKVDTAKAKGLLTEFEKTAKFDGSPAVTKYLSSLAKRLMDAEPELRSESVSVRVLLDNRKELKRPFSFPGIMIFIPKTFLHQVNYENELAAMIALELAQVMNRDLAREIEENPDRPILGNSGLFQFSPESRGSAIEIGTRILYAAGYDPRGMVALLENYPALYLDDSKSISQDQRYFVKQAQKTKNEFMPSLQPIVRSNDFLQMKKNLKRSS